MKLKRLFTHIKVPVKRLICALIVCYIVIELEPKLIRYWKCSENSWSGGGPQTSHSSTYLGGLNKLATNQVLFIVETLYRTTNTIFKSITLNDCLLQIGCLNSIKLSFTYRCCVTNAVIDKRIKRGRRRTVKVLIDCVAQSMADYLFKNLRNSYTSVLFFFWFYYKVHIHAATYFFFNRQRSALLLHILVDITFLFKIIFGFNGLGVGILLIKVSVWKGYFTVYFTKVVMADCDHFFYCYSPI